MAFGPRSSKRSLFVLCLLLETNCFAEIVIPIELENGNPVAVALINKIAVRLVIDSGGEAITLKSDALRKVNAVPSGSVSSGNNILGETGDQAVFKIATLSIGGKSFADLEVVEAGTYAANSPADGVIGRDFLNRYLAVYDYPARTIRLFTRGERRSAARLCQGTEVRTIPDPDRIIVSMATTDHARVRVIWDTGAQYSFIKKTFAEDHKLPVEAPFYSSRSLVMGGLDFGPLKFVVIDAAAPAIVDGFIGFNFFETHVVCIDPSRRSIRIHQPEGVLPGPPL